MKRVFFYGLFMDEEILEDLGCNPVRPEIARLEGYGLRIGEKATLIRSDNEYCLGQLISLAEEEIDSLYAPKNLSEYYPESVVVKTKNNKLVPTCTYILPEDKLSGSNSDYAQKLHSSATRLGFSEAYLKIIEKYFR